MHQAQRAQSVRDARGGARRITLLGSERMKMRDSKRLREKQNRGGSGRDQAEFSNTSAVSRGVHD